MFARRGAALVVALSSLGATTVPAQVVGATPQGNHRSDSSAVARFDASAGLYGLALVSRADPLVGRRAYTEGYLAQPLIMARASAFRRQLEAVLSIDFEGLTLDRGQLTPGAYGEGYVDRRHPHTYLHEAMIAAQGAFGRTGVSLAAGKGFVTFGTDDPMMRPFAAYPVNHHLAQILERYVAAVAVRRGPVIVEASLFTGDEPLSAGSPPDADRFGDSWAARATTSLRSGLELQGSYAFVTSPEIAEGGGLDQHKWSASARVERPTGPIRYALVEWAWTDAVLGDVSVNRFSSLLGEASTSVRSFTGSVRYENTTRPEEVRLLDPFRTSRSPTDLSIIGVTRWQTVTGAVSTTRSLGPVSLAPFAEVAWSRPTQEVRPSAFEPKEFYGTSSIWMMSAGLRFGIGRMHHRMGRYGVAAPNTTHAAHSTH